MFYVCRYLQNSREETFLRFVIGPFSNMDEVNVFCDVMLIAYTQNMHIENQKEFALAIKDIPGNSLMFTARKSNMSIPAVFHSLDLHRKLRLFGL